jgi:hypothetical protein
MAGVPAASPCLEHACSCVCAIYADAFHSANQPTYQKKMIAAPAAKVNKNSNHQNKSLFACQC